MVCYALLCVFSRFALILMLASATSMWERRLDLKVYVFYLPFHGGASFVDLFCYLCFVFVMLSFRLFIAVLWSTAWKGLTSWLSCMW